MTDKAVIELCQEERYALWVIFNRPDSWGGGEDALLVRDECWDALCLESLGSPVVAKLAERQALERRTFQRYELADAEIEYLIGVVVGGGQSRVLGRISAAILRKLRLLCPRKEPASEPPSEPEESEPPKSALGSVP